MKKESGRQISVNHSMGNSRYSEVMLSGSRNRLSFQLWAKNTSQVYVWKIVIEVSFELEYIVYKLELDRVYPNLKTRRVLVIFPKRSLKKTWSQMIAKTWTRKKKMHFGQILVKISSQTCKPKNLTSFEPIFLNQKNSNSKKFGILKPEKLKPELLRGN